MAIYHCSTKTVNRSSGRTAVASAAYRAGEKLEDERTGLTHDFTRKDGVVHTEILSNLDIQSPLFCISHSPFQPEHYRMNHQLYRLMLVNLQLLNDWYSE